jgi:hypothetical protein
VCRARRAHQLERKREGARKCPGALASKEAPVRKPTDGSPSVPSKFTTCHCLHAVPGRVTTRRQSWSIPNIRVAAINRSLRPNHRDEDLRASAPLKELQKIFGFEPQPVIPVGIYHSLFRGNQATICV